MLGLVSAYIERETFTHDDSSRLLPRLNAFEPKNPQIPRIVSEMLFSAIDKGLAIGTWPERGLLDLYAHTYGYVSCTLSPCPPGIKVVRRHRVRDVCDVGRFFFVGLFVGGMIAEEASCLLRVEILLLVLD